MHRFRPDEVAHHLHGSALAGIQQLGHEFVCLVEANLVFDLRRVGVEAIAKFSASL
jgi:hypothetical protein